MPGRHEPARAGALHRCLTHSVGLLTGLALIFVFSPPSVQAADFIAFESGPVRPMALSPDGHMLFAVNTPDNRLEIFGVDDGGTLAHSASVAVGMEPVAVAVRDASEVWVVNHLSDSVSIVNVAGLQDGDAADSRTPFVARARCWSAMSRATSSLPGKGLSSRPRTVASSVPTLPLPMYPAREIRNCTGPGSAGPMSGYSMPGSPARAWAASR